MMILCALHAKHPWYQKSCNQLEKAVQKALYIARDPPIWCYVPQLSKGIEFLKCLNQKNTRKIPVYLDLSLIHILRKIFCLKDETDRKLWFEEDDIESQKKEYEDLTEQVKL